MHLALRHKFLIVCAIIGALSSFIVPRTIRNTIPQDLGVTFSHEFAWSLGYNWQDAYTALLDDMGVRRFRIPVYWDDIEPEQGKFDFGRVDWEVNEAEKRYEMLPEDHKVGKAVGGAQHLSYIEACIEMHAQMSALNTLLSIIGYIPKVLMN